MDESPHSTGTGTREGAAPGDSPATLSPELCERLPGRDPEALAALFDAFFPRVYGYVRRMVGDDHLAEDLTQDVFLHVHRAIEGYDPARALRPWVFTIATNKVRDHWRSRRHRDAQSDESVEQDAVARTLSVLQPPEGPLSDAEIGERVRRAVEALPEGMRSTVLLRVYEDLSFEEIGAVLDRNEVAVRKRFSRALELLRQALGPAWEVHAEGP